jgi:hypothetical protein
MPPTSFLREYRDTASVQDELPTESASISSIAPPHRHVKRGIRARPVRSAELQQYSGYFALKCALFSLIMHAQSFRLTAPAVAAP